MQPGCKISNINRVQLVSLLNSNMQFSRMDKNGSKTDLGAAESGDSQIGSRKIKSFSTVSPEKDKMREKVLSNSCLHCQP